MRSLAIGIVAFLPVLALVFACSSGAGRISARAPGATGAQASTAPTGSPLMVATPDMEGPVPIDPEDARWGDDDAPVTIVVATDLQCPFCARGQATLHALEQRYGPKTLRVVFKHMPLDFHPMARPAALAAMNVQRQRGDAAFFDFVDLVFAHQNELSMDALGQWAGAVRSAGSARSFASTPDQQLDRDLAYLAERGVRGTPQFFVNGFRVMGAQPLAIFTTAIDAELAAIDDARKAGQPVRYANRAAANYGAEPTARDTEGDDDDDRVYKVPVGNSPVFGAPDALVTIVEFNDFQCPFCKRAQGTVDQLVQKYGRDVRIVFKHHPLDFHDRAGPASALALEAYREKGNPAFWQASRSLFGATNEAFTEDSLIALGKALGLNPVKVKSAVLRGADDADIQSDIALAAAVSAQGTPCFFINGVKLAGAQPYGVFVQVIDEQLAAARAMVAAGAAPRDVYDRVMKMAE